MHLKRRYRWPQNVFALDALKEFKWQRRLAEKSSFQCIVYKTKNKYNEISTKYECVGLDLFEI